MRDLLTTIYRYRGFIWSSVKRDFQARYQTSMLGALWLVLQPLSMILVYTLVFSEVMKARMPDNTGPFAYSIYLCSGVLTWGLFTEMLDKGQSVFINNANLIKKLSFPKICLPIIVTLSAVLNFAIIFSLFLIFIIVTGNFPGWLFLSVIPVLLLQILFRRWAGYDPWCDERLFQGRGTIGWGCTAILVLVHPYCLCTKFIASMGKKSAAV